VLETSYPDRVRPWLVGSGAIGILVCVVMLVGFGSPWGIPVLAAALATLCVGLWGQERNVSAVPSPRGRFMFAAHDPPEPKPETGLMRMSRLSSHPAFSIPVQIALALLFGYLLGNGSWVPALGLGAWFVTAWGLPAKVIDLVNARSLEAPASDRFLALADPRHPLGTGPAPDAAGTPRRSAVEALRAVGREWTHEEYREVRRLVGRGIAEEEACRTVRGKIVPAGDSPAEHSRLVASGAAAED
jgi:hypothetical protein